MLVTPSYSEMVNSMVFGIQQPRHLTPEQNAKMEGYVFETIKTLYQFVFGFMIEFIQEVFSGFFDGLSMYETLFPKQETKPSKAAAMIPFMGMPGIQLTNVTQQ